VWVLFGLTLGQLTQLLNDLTARVFGPETAPATDNDSPKKRIVILGGGFAGMTAAECLDRTVT
jgi:hypothetical protein